jgi:SAM-dependent methyltransferase
VADAPSDSLRDAYERRGALEYPEPFAPDPAVDRKFAVLTETIRGLLPVDSYLDAGCGDGRYLASLPDLGRVPARVVGMDIADSILATARRAAAARGVHPELVRANLERLPFGDAEFDLVVSVQVLEHLLDPRAGAFELARVLRPGGTLVLSTDNDRMLVTRTLNGPRWALASALRRRNSRPFEFPHRAFSRLQITTLLTEAGLEIGSVRTFRFSLVGASPRVVRALNRLDRRLPDLGVGDVLLVVARRPL